MAVFALPKRELNDPFSRLFQGFRNRSATENSYPDFLVSGTAISWLELRYKGINEDTPFFFQPLSITSIEPVSLRRNDAPQDSAMNHLETVAQSGDELSFIKAINRIDWNQRSGDEFTTAIRMALQVGAYLKARKLAQQGVEQYPNHSELVKFSHILAPPKVTKSSEPPDPTLRLNRDWLLKHSEEYQGRWVALKAGQLLAVGDSPMELKRRLGDTRKILLTKVY